MSVRIVKFDYRRGIVGNCIDNKSCCSGGEVELQSSLNFSCANYISAVLCFPRRTNTAEWSKCGI